MPSEDNNAEDGGGPAEEAPQNDVHRSKKDTSIPFDPTKDSLSTARDIAARTSEGGSNSIDSRRRGSNKSRRRSSGGGRSSGRTPRKMSSDTAADRPSLEGIFQETDDDDSNSDIFDVGAETASPSPRRDSERRHSSDSVAALGTPRRSSRPQSAERSNKRKSTSRDRPSRMPTDSPPRRGRRPGGPTGPPLLSQTQHAARSLSAIGAGGSRRPRTRAELKEQGRAREWASFCRRKTYLSLDDLSREERPRVARKGIVTPFSLHLMKVEGWTVPSVLVERASAAGHGLRFSLSVSFYHAGSKRFYGDTFMGELLDEEDGDRVEVISERRHGVSSLAKKGSSRKERSARWKTRNNRDKKGSGRRRRDRHQEDDDDDYGDDDDDQQEMEVATRHEELVYWYTAFEDPNCVAVVELVATIMDTGNGIQVGQYGCGWTFIQFFGPNEPEAVQHRDVYRGSPRNLLFFEQGDWGSVGETVIPGCSLWFTLSVWENLLKARHLFRLDEIVSALDVLPGMQVRKIAVPDKPAKFGPFLGLTIDEDSRPSSRRRGEGGGRWIISPVRPRLSACLELRLSALRVIIPGRGGYERDLLKHLGEDTPDQEIVKSTTHQHTLGFSTTQREVVSSSAGGARGGKGGGGAQRAKIVDRRAKIGFHNGRTLVLPHEWVETHLEETDEDDVLMLPAEVSSLNVDGFVAHPLFALVVLIEYTIRTRPKAAGSGRGGGGGGGGGRGRKGDPVAQAQAEQSNAALPVVVGMQVFLPHDGKRLRLCNTPRNKDSMGVCLRLAADKNVRLVTTDLVYTNKNHLLDEAHGGTSDGEDGRGPKMVFFDLKAYDSHGKRLEDETPVSADESPLEADWDPPKELASETSASSDGTSSSSTDSTSSESSAESSSSSSDAEVTPAAPKTKKPKPPPKRRPAKIKRKREAQSEPSSDDSSDDDDASLSLVRGDSDSSFLRRRGRPKKRNAHVQATEKGWDDWRKSIKVPRRSESLMGQTLQAPLHVEASAQTAIDRPPDLTFNRPQAMAVGGFAPLPQGLSRGSRTRLSRHGFVDVMKDTQDSFAQTSGGASGRQVPIDLDLEVTDPLAKHEVTLQFAAFRSLCGGAGGPSAAASDGDGGMGRPVATTPTSLYFTYQFYTCLPTRTERMLLRPDAPKDRMYKAEGGGESRLSILVRDGRYGREEPSLGLRHSIDTTMMQPFEAQAFATYMAGSALFVDVWDGDALMHLGTLAVPLRALLRQQTGVVKNAMEYEVVASTTAAEDSGMGGGLAVAHGSVGQGPVIGLVQILASNYGEPGRGGDLPSSGALPGTIHLALTDPDIRGDWRLASGPAGGGCGSGQRGTRPRHKVRARPLSDTNPEISKYLEAVSGPGAGGGTAIASLGRRGRGDADADSMGYDELMLLVRRFRGPTKGTVWYSGPLLRLLDVPGRKQLEQQLVRAIERSERSGLSLAEAFRAMDQHRMGEISTHDLEEMFRGMLAPGEMTRDQLRALVKSMDPGATGKIGLQELVTFVRARQGGGKTGGARKAAELSLKRALARAELGGSSVEEAFSLLDDKGEDSVSHAGFWQAVHSLGGVPGLVKTDLDPLLRRFDTGGNGRVSLASLMRWADRNFSSSVAVENAARKKILKAEAAALRDGRKSGVSVEEAFSAADDLSGALKAIGGVHLTPRETGTLRRRLEIAGGGGINIPAVILFFGRADQKHSTPSERDGTPREAVSGDEKKARSQEDRLLHKLHQDQQDEKSAASEVERKLKNIVIKAESTGTSLAEVFGVFDKDGSGFITVAELEEGLRELRVFDIAPKDQVLSLARKFKSAPASSTGRDLGDDNVETGDGEIIVSAEEFVRFIGGEYEATEAAQSRLRRVLQLAEEKEGVTLEAAFGALDKNGTGNISTADLEEGLRQLKVFDGMSKEQASLATRRFDQNGDGTVSLPDFLAFAGKPYAVHDRPLEAKLRRVLLKAESMGTSMEDAFKHFDKDGCGSITEEGFSTGLREMGVFQEFSPEEIDEVVSNFGGDGDGAVSLPKFLRFLGKEYGRGVGGRRGDTGRETGSGRSLAGRLRLILKKAHELGTPLSASFQGFGADAGGRLSPQQLHAALKDIGQFRWTTLGEVKGFIRLLQDDDIAPTNTPTTTAREETSQVEPTNADETRGTVAIPSSQELEVFLTLPALEAFVEGGDDFLSRKERAAVARRQSRDARSSDLHHLTGAQVSPGRQTQDTDEKTNVPRPRADSWAAVEGDPGGNVSDRADGTSPGPEEEGALLENLRLVLARAPGATSRNNTGCEDVRTDGEGVRGHLDSFDVDGDGVLQPAELIAALRSLGARGRDFHGRRGVDAILQRFRDGADRSTSVERPQTGATIVKLAWWFEEQPGSDVRGADAVADRRSSTRSAMEGSASKPLEGREGNKTAGSFAAGDALRKAVRIAEAKGTTLERTFARLDDDGDGFITLRQLLRGLDQLGVFEKASRDDVLDVLDELGAERQSSRATKGSREEETKDGGRDISESGMANGVDLVAFIRLMRQRPRDATSVSRARGDGQGNEDHGDEPDKKAPESEQATTYEFSLDPDTKAAEKKLRRVVAKQVRLGVDVEGVFQRYDPDQSGSVLRSDFTQAVMELGVGLLDSSNSRPGNRFAHSAAAVDHVRQRQLGQLARTKGPVERRLMRMRQSRRSLFDQKEGAGGGGGEAKGGDEGHDPFEGGDESLALIQWYREGQKKSLVRHILATSLTTEYNLFFAFASPLFFEHPLRNPFNHEERFRIDLDDHQLRVVTGASEWAHLRRNVSPCVGDIGESPLERDFFDVDPERGVQITLMAHEVVFIPFAFLSLEPRCPTSLPSTPGRSERSSRGGADGHAGVKTRSAPVEGGAGTAERSVVVAFVSTSHGHVISVVQVHLQRRAFVVNRTFRFFQAEGEILKRSIQLVPGEGSLQRLSTSGKRSLGIGGVDGGSQTGSGGGGGKYIHCVEEAGQGHEDANKGGVVIEWSRRAAAMGGSTGGGIDVQEVLLKCRVGQFPWQKGFYLLVFDDHFQASLYETWHIIVQARLRMDVHSLLGQQSPADLVVRGDRYSRKVRAFSSAAAEVSFEPADAFQLVPGAYNRVKLRFRPLVIGSRKIYVHLVDVDSAEIVAAWVATATAMPPVVSKSYEVDLPLGRACHKRIAYSNPWNSTRLFRLASSDPSILRPRYESLEVAGGGTGFLRLWFAAPEGLCARREAFLFVNDTEGQNEECLLICMRGV